MEMCTFAVENGYAEGILRGLRSSFLTEQQYMQIKNCANIGELRSFLEDTDYGPFLISESPNMVISTLKSKLKKKIGEEIDYIRCNSTGVLVDFLDIISIKYQIDNVVNLIEGLKNKVDYDILMANIDPLGYFPQIRNIKVLEGDDYSSLYREVLIDTPVGPYFMRFLEQELKKMSDARSFNDVQNIFRDIKPQQIRSSLKKLWLQDFYEFCLNELNSTSVEMLEDLIKFQADFKTIQVVYNSIGNKQLNTAAKISEARNKLCPALGYLYPDSKKSLLQATTSENLKQAVKGVADYYNLVNDAPDPSKKQDYNASQRTLDDIMYDMQCKRYALAFDQANQFAVFYAYLKLKEQQVRNIIWMAEMISRNLGKNHAGWKKVIVPFSHLGN